MGDAYLRGRKPLVLGKSSVEDTELGGLLEAPRAVVGLARGKTVQSLRVEYASLDQFQKLRRGTHPLDIVSL